MGNKRLEIFIDTNTFKHLAEVEINRKPSYQKIFEIFNVHTCSAVKKEFGYKAHIRDPRHLILSKKLSGNSAKVLRTRKMKKLETLWLSRFYKKAIENGKDESERNLVCILIELIIERKITRGILVTDDYTARTSFLDAIYKSFMLGEIWNSADLLIHLYLITSSVSYKSMEIALRDLIAIESMSWKKYKRTGDREQDAKIKMIGDYVNRLKEIKILKENYV